MCNLTLHLQTLAIPFPSHVPTAFEIPGRGSFDLTHPDWRPDKVLKQKRVNAENMHLGAQSDICYAR